MNTKPNGYYVTTKKRLPDGTKVVSGHWTPEHPFPVLHEVDTDNQITRDEYRAKLEALQQKLKTKCAADATPPYHHIEYGASLGVQTGAPVPLTPYSALAFDGGVRPCDAIYSQSQQPGAVLHYYHQDTIRVRDDLTIVHTIVCSGRVVEGFTTLERLGDEDIAKIADYADRKWARNVQPIADGGMWCYPFLLTDEQKRIVLDAIANGKPKPEFEAPIRSSAPA